MIRLFIYLFVFISIFATSACSEKGREIADINGKAITQEQFDAYVKFKRIPVRDEKKLEALFEQYLEREALAAVIEKSDALDKALIEAELNEFRKEMLISRYFESYLRDKVNDQSVQNYYASNADKYEERKVHVTHILLRTSRNMGETERKAKLTAAQEAYSKLQTGMNFEEAAKTYSEDTVSAKKGGDLGWLKEGSIDKKFSDTVFNMKPGEISEIIETPFGFHIIKLVEGPMTTKRPLEVVKGDIRYQLRNQAKEAELERLLSEARINRK